MNKIIFNKDNIIRKIGEGKESVVYLYKANIDGVVALKYFKNIIQTPFGPDIPVTKEVMENKERKIEIIPEIKELSEDVKIYNLVYDGDIFVGYTMDVDYYKSLEEFSFSSIGKKIDLLKMLKERIEKLNEQGIYIGNFSPSNFGVTDNGIKLFSLDNFRIKDYDFDLKDQFINKYEQKSSIIDNVDNYCFNYFTLSYLMNIVPNTIDYNVQMNGLPHKLNTATNKKLYDELTQINDSYKKRYFIDSTKKGLFK